MGNISASELQICPATLNNMAMLNLQIACVSVSPWRACHMHAMVHQLGTAMVH